jgi:hypothetical protein
MSAIINRTLDVNDIRHFGEWLVLCVPLLHLLASLAMKQEISRVQRWCKVLLEQASAKRLFDDHQLLCLRWLSTLVRKYPSDASPLHLCLTSAEKMGSQPLCLETERRSSSVFHMTVECVWNWFLTDLDEPIKDNFRTFPSPMELRSMHANIDFDFNNSSKDSKERHRWKARLWDFGFLVTHLYLCRSAYGAQRLQVEEGDRELMEILVILGHTKGLVHIPDLLAEIVFCLGLFCESSEDDNFVQELIVLGDNLLGLQQEDGSLPLEPSLHERAFLHGQFVFSHAMLIVARNRGRLIDFRDK